MTVVLAADTCNADPVMAEAVTPAPGATPQDGEWKVMSANPVIPATAQVAVHVTIVMVRVISVVVSATVLVLLCITST